MTETRHLCSIREGCKSCFLGGVLVVSSVKGVYVYDLDNIIEGELLPREGDSPLFVCH